MSRTIRMKFSYQGLHAPGQPWPPYNGTMEVSDEEAAQLVATGNAMYLEDDLAGTHDAYKTLAPLLEDDPRIPNPEVPRNEEPELLNAHQERKPSEETGLVSEDPDEPGEVKRPYVNMKKEDWIHYAISQGEPKEIAVNMSKVDLISKYGSSL